MEKMNESGMLGELAAALNKAQAQMGPVIKDSKNPFFKSKYAKLPDVIDALRAPLADNGLCFVQTHAEREDHTYLVTKIMHISGQWISGELKLRPGKNDMQGIMAASTYAKRCALVAMFGLAEEDDDGNATQRRHEVVEEVKNLSDDIPDPVSPINLSRTWSEKKVLVTQLQAELSWNKEAMASLIQNVSKGRVSTIGMMTDEEFERLIAKMRNEIKVGEVK
jgi:ERF superfamily protein